MEGLEQLLETCRGKVGRSHITHVNVRCGESEREERGESG